MIDRLTNRRWTVGFAFVLLASWPAGTWAQDIVEVGDRSLSCLEDAACFNRLHPAIPMVARAHPGATIVLHSRNARGFDIDPSAPPDPREGDVGVGTVHSLTGPVYIEGAEPGDVLKVRILDIAPGAWAWTSISPAGFVSDKIEGPLRIVWRLNRDYAVSDDLPGVRIPNRSFPGVVTVLPGPEQHAQMLDREAELLEEGGAVMPPTHLTHASPQEVCGEGGSHAGSVCGRFLHASTAATWTSGICRQEFQSTCLATWKGAGWRSEIYTSLKVTVRFRARRSKWMQP